MQLVRLDLLETVDSKEFEETMGQLVTLVSQDNKVHKVTVVLSDLLALRVLPDPQASKVRRVRVDQMVQQAVPATRVLSDWQDQSDPRDYVVHRVLLVQPASLVLRDPEDCRVSVDQEVQLAQLDRLACQVRVVQLAQLVRQEIKVQRDWLASRVSLEFRDGRDTLE